MVNGQVSHAATPGSALELELTSPYSGYHAKSPQEFAEAFHSVFQLSRVEDLGLRQRAREWAVKRFSNEEFEKGWDDSRWKEWLR